MGDRLGVTKTYKLFVGGKFPRTESGRTLPVHDAQQNLVAHVCHASRKDLRDAVEAARKAQSGWAEATAYLRGQVLYRLAEMMEGRRVELIASLGGDGAAEREVDAAIDRVTAFAGWTDKIQQVLGCANPVAGPYHNFTVPTPTGVVVAVAPDEAPLLGLLTLALPALATGSAVVAVASEARPIPSMVLAEAVATSDLPGGVLNILTGVRSEFCPHVASHREINAVVAGGVTDDQAAMLRAGAAENMKRVTIETASGDDWFDNDWFESPWAIEPMLEFKTLWHPSST